MKVILLQNLPHLGQKGDIKDVKDGYARNFLFPQNLAKPASEGAIKEAEALKTKRESGLAVQKSAFAEAAGKLKDSVIEFEAKTNEQGGLFRAISKKQIAAKLAKIGFKDISESEILIKEPIKKTGEHEAIIERGEIRGTLKVRVKSSNKPKA
ncbi:MAG: 50S ribosomal protein L9 [Patescibacteria group bacterium]